MKLNQLIYFVQGLQQAIRIGTAPTLKAVWCDPALLFRPYELSRVYMAHVWAVYSDASETGARSIKEKLVISRASGVVLEIGAGYGSLIGYLDKSRVTAYIAVEPNAHMHSRLRQTASKAGFQEENGSFLLIPCGAENIDTILAALSAWSTGPGRERIVSQTGTIQSPEGAKTYNGYIVNTLVSILTLCSIPEPQNTLRALVRNVLLPGGQFIFSEHVRSPLKDVAWWQDVVAPIWRLCFDGCIIGRDSMKVIREAANEVTGNSDERQGWESMETWSEDEMDSESMFWIQLGACVKRGGNETAFHAI